mgnify:CR=1 FL=1
MAITIISVIILILSAVIHEYAHGWMAWRLGDNTAKDEGRLTLNPFAHLDLVGSVILPLLLILSKAGFFLAWAKPVPYNPYNLRDRKYGELKVALAGPATNIIIAFVFGLIARFLPLALETKQALLIGFLSGDATQVFSLTAGSVIAGLEVVALMVCFINLALAIFNLIPVPPLDGSKIISAFLPQRGREWFWKIDRYGFVILFALIYLGAFSFISTAVFWAFSLLTAII